MVDVFGESRIRNHRVTGMPMVAAVTFSLLWAALLVSRGTPLGDLMRCVMVELPAAALGRLRRVDLVVAAVVVLLVALHLSAGEADPVRFVALFAPDLAAWMASVELASLIEAAAALVTTLSMVRPSSPKRDRIADAMRRARILRTGNVRSVRHRRPKGPANDDEGRGVLTSVA